MQIVQYVMHKSIDDIESKGEKTVARKMDACVEDGQCDWRKIGDGSG